MIKKGLANLVKIEAKLNFFIFLFLTSIFIFSFFCLDKSLAIATTNLLFYIWSALFLICGVLFFLKIKKLFNILIFVFIFFSGILYYSYSYSQSFNSQVNFFNSILGKRVAVHGRISARPIYFNDQVILEINPKIISNRVNNSYRPILVPLKVYDFENEKSPEYRDFFALEGSVRRLSESEKLFLYNLGVKSDVFFVLDNVNHLKHLSETVDNYFFDLLKDFRKSLFTIVCPQQLVNQNKSEMSFLKGIFLGDFSDLGVIYKTEKNSNNPLFFFIKSNFYIWFLLFLSFFVLKRSGQYNNTLNNNTLNNNTLNNNTLKPQQRLFFRKKDGSNFALVTTVKSFKSKLQKYFSFKNDFYRCFRGYNFLHVFSIIFVLFLNALHMCAFNIIAPSLILVLFLIFSMYLSPQKSILYAINWAVFLILLFDPFIFTDKWFIYFLSFSFVFFIFTARFNNFLSEFLQGWKFWGFVCILFGLSFFGLHKFTHFYVYLYILFSILWMFFMHFLQHKYPIVNLTYKNNNILIRLFVSSYFLLFFLVILPFNLFYSNAIDISSLFLFLPLILLLMLVFQFGFIYLFISFIVLSIFPKQVFHYLIEWFNVLPIFFTDILQKYFIILTMYFSEKYSFILKTSYIYIPIYAVVLGLIYLCLKRKKIFKFKKSFVITGLFILFFLGVYVFAKNCPAKMKLFSNDYARFCYINLPSKKNILFINIFKKEYESMQFRINSKYANRDFFSKNKISRLDYLIVRGLLKNPASSDVLADIFEDGNITLKSYHFNKINRNKNLEYIKNFLEKNEEKNIKIFFDVDLKDLEGHFDFKVFYKEYYSIKNLFTHFQRQNFDYKKLTDSKRIIQDEYKGHIFLMDFVSSDVLKFQYDSDTFYFVFDSKAHVYPVKDNINLKHKSLLFKEDASYFELIMESLEFSGDRKDKEKLDVKVLGNKIKIV